MFRKRKELRRIELTSAEKHLLIYAMICFRNKLIALKKPTEDVNDILLKLI